MIVQKKIKGLVIEFTTSIGVSTLDCVYNNLLNVHKYAQLFTLGDVKHDLGGVGGQRHHIKLH